MHENLRHHLLLVTMDIPGLTFISYQRTRIISVDIVLAVLTHLHLKAPAPFLAILAACRSLAIQN